MPPTDQAGTSIAWSGIMLGLEQVDQVICQLATWDRQTLMSELLAFQSKFPVDLTADYLATLSDDRIRHVFLAMCLQNQRLPVGSMSAA
jgi:hypothetical protein